jgi:hypothetical protein
MARWPSWLWRQVKATLTAIPGGAIRVGSSPTLVKYFLFLLPHMSKPVESAKFLYETSPQGVYDRIRHCLRSIKLFFSYLLIP